MGVQSRYPGIKIKPISHFTSTRFSTFSFYYDVWSNRTRTSKKYFTGFLLFRKNFSVKYLEFRIVPNRTEKSFTVRSLYIWWLLLLFLYKTLKFFFKLLVSLWTYNSPLRDIERNPLRREYSMFQIFLPIGVMLPA